MRDYGAAPFRVRLVYARRRVPPLPYVVRAFQPSLPMRRLPSLLFAAANAKPLAALVVGLAATAALHVVARLFVTVVARKLAVRFGFVLVVALAVF